MIAFPLVEDKFPAQLDDLRQIQVVPLHPAVALRDTLEARIEATADVNHNRLRVAGQEIPRVAVEFPVAQDHCHLVLLVHMDLPDPVEVIAHLRDQRHGFLVFDQCIRALRFHRPDVERHEQRFSHATQV